jgi:primosomal protein N' (replication factor Y)
LSSADGSGCLVDVALPPPLSRQLTYRVPADLLGTVRLGSMVLVPVQGRLLTGFVVTPARPQTELAPSGPASQPPSRGRTMRDIVQVLDADMLAPDVIELCRWMADYYLLPLGAALATAIPPGIKMTSNRLVSLVTAPADTNPVLDLEDSRSFGGELETRICSELKKDGPLNVTTLQRRLGKSGMEPCLRRLSRVGHIEVRPVIQEAQVTVRHEQIVRLLDQAESRQQLAQLQVRAPKQGACLDYLLTHGDQPKKGLVARGFGYSVINELCARGLLETVAGEVVRDPLSHIVAEDALPLNLTDDQDRVLQPLLAALDEVKFHAFLLKGVTGSGKTLVYMRAAAHALAAGKSVIILVPEIALAWQMVRRFKSHFGSQVAVLHSQLSGGERYDTWRRLRRGEQRLVIGARSAILAPMRDLGLIVIDEEHDASYTQDDLESRQPTAYSARDLSLVRGRLASAVVILGSATPSLESFWNACSGKYELLELPNRVDDRSLPSVEVVDMRREPFQRKERSLFSHLLRTKMHDRLEKGEKILLLLNRRGYAPVVQCQSCGESVQCDRCRVSLTLHRAGSDRLRCHYCDFSCAVPELCPSCSSEEVRLEGIGTQRVEQALLEQFDGIRVIRMDVDTTGWKGAHDELVERFRRGEADVLLGTQMIAKGLDFPEVTLVGVISADTGLHMPDFRATERSFQLLTQVAGRSGRGKNPGEVVIQTCLPESPVIEAAARQDFDAFAALELEERRSAGFPPFGRLVVFRWRGANEEQVERAAKEGVSSLLLTAAGASVLGPAPAPLAQLRGKFRWQALMVGATSQETRGAARRAIPELRSLAAQLDVEMAAVVDPQLTM